jgi:hypothetical protein
MNSSRFPRRAFTAFVGFSKQIAIIPTGSINPLLSVMETELCLREVKSEF